MPYSTLKHTTEGRLAVITLNRPDRRNALDDVMIKELTDAFVAVNRNGQVRTAVLVGSGEAFCAGMDLAYLQRSSQMTQEENLEDARSLLKLLQLISTLRKPVIAAVNGAALGGGCGMAAACDFVFAGREKARIGAPEVRLGFLPAVILLFLIRRMGWGRAKEFVLRGDVLDAAAARDMGLVTEVVDDAQLEPTVLRFADRLARTTSPASLTLTKDLFSRFDDMGVRDAMEYAATLNALTRKTEDFRKGIDAFLRKETLEW